MVELQVNHSCLPAVSLKYYVFVYSIIITCNLLLNKNCSIYANRYFCDIKVSYFTNWEVSLLSFRKCYKICFEWQLTKLFCSTTFGGSVKKEILKFLLGLKGKFNN